MRVFLCWPPAMVLGIMRNGGHPQLRTLRDAEAELPDENEDRDAGMEQPRLGVGRLRKRHTMMEEESTTWTENTVRGPGRDESGAQQLSELFGSLLKELNKAVQAPSKAPQLPKVPQHESVQVPKTVQPHGAVLPREPVQVPKTVQPHGAELFRDRDGGVRGALDDRNTNMTSRAAGRTAAQLNARAAVGFGLLRPSISEDGDGRRLLLSPNRLPDGMGNYVSARVSFLGCQLRIEWGRGPRHPEEPEDPRISGGSAEMRYRIHLMECLASSEGSSRGRLKVKGEPSRLVARWWRVRHEPPTIWEAQGMLAPYAYSAADEYLASRRKQRLQATATKVRVTKMTHELSVGEVYEPDYGEYEKYDRSGFPSLLLQYRGEKLHLWPDYDKALSQRKSCDAPEAGKELLVGAGVTSGPRAVEISAAAGSSEECRRACEEALSECDRYTFTFSQDEDKGCHFQTEPLQVQQQVGGGDQAQQQVVYAAQPQQQLVSYGEQAQRSPPAVQQLGLPPQLQQSGPPQQLQQQYDYEEVAHYNLQEQQKQKKSQQQRPLLRQGVPAPQSQQQVLAPPPQQQKQYSTTGGGHPQPVPQLPRPASGNLTRSGVCRTVARDVVEVGSEWPGKLTFGLPFDDHTTGGRGKLAAAANAVCDVQSLLGSDVVGLDDVTNADVRDILRKNPTAAKLRSLGPEHQRIPPPAELQNSPDRRSPNGLLGGGKDDLANDAAFSGKDAGWSSQDASFGSCAVADKDKAQRLAREWGELARTKPVPLEAELQKGSAVQTELANDLPTASFALELMRPSTCELEAQHTTAGHHSWPGWALYGLSLSTVISALLFTNGQLAGTNYLFRKGIAVVLGETSQHSEWDLLAENWIRPSVQFADGLSFNTQFCDQGQASFMWSQSLTLFANKNKDQAGKLGGQPDVPMLVVADTVDVTGLGFMLNKGRTEMPPQQGWDERILKMHRCEKAADRLNLRGVVLVGEAGGYGGDATQIRERVSAAILGAQEHVSSKYDLAVSTLKEFKEATEIGGDGETMERPNPVSPDKVLAWQKKYRIEKEALDCSPKPPPPEGTDDPADAAGSSAPPPPPPEDAAAGAASSAPPPPPPEDAAAGAAGAAGAAAAAADGSNTTDTGGEGSTCCGYDTKGGTASDADQSGGGTANQVQAASSSAAPPTPGAKGTHGAAGAGESSSTSGNVKVAVASYNILSDLQIPTEITAPFMKKKCESAGASHEQCITNAGSLIAKYKEEGKPPIALLGEQEYMAATGKAPFLKGLGADWKLLTDHITCAVWYNQALLPNAKAPAATTLGNRNDGPLVFLSKDLTPWVDKGRFWDSDPEGVRCAVAGYFPDQRLLFGSLWCVHPDKVAGENCVAAALSRFRKLADANEWKDYDRVIVAMDSNDQPAKLLGKSFPVRTPSGKNLSLRIGSSPLKTCCYSHNSELRFVGDYVADTAEQDSDPFIVPGAVARTTVPGAFIDPVGLRSDHIPVMKSVVLPGGGSTP